MNITEAEYARLRDAYAADPSQFSGNGRAFRDHIEANDLADLNAHPSCTAEARAWLDAHPVIPTTVAELVPGDVVRLTGRAWASSQRDREVTIRRVGDGCGYIEEQEVANHVTDNTGSWGFTFVRHADTPATPEVPAFDADTTFDAYHPSMLPMIEKLSKAADDAGYCAEYDRMARSIGAPTRAEVRRLVQERDGAKRQIRYTVPVTVTYVTEDAHQSDEDALSELRVKLGSWPGVIEVISNSIQSGRWDALPVGGSVPDDATVTVVN